MDENIASIFSNASQWRVLGGFINRNNTVSTLRVVGQYYFNDYIVQEDVNDVAMTVLPNAPIDSATGLPIPTIAVATDGGVSVIKDDGNVWDITNSSGTYTFSDKVSFGDGGVLYIDQGSSSDGVSWIYMFTTLPTADNVISLDTKTGSTLNPTAMYEPRDVIGAADLVNLGVATLMVAM
jgi:hypothetical protein